jgi:hypothetical protein
VNHRCLIALSILVAGAAAAAQAEHYSAKLAQPLAAEKTFVANGNIWRCAGTDCTLTSIPKDADSVRTCHELKRQAGALTAYGSTATPYDATKIAKCNN